MTRKPDVSTTADPAIAPDPPAPSPGQHPHILPQAGGSYVIVDGRLVPDPAIGPAALPQPDPEV